MGGREQLHCASAGLARPVPVSSTAWCTVRVCKQPSPHEASHAPWSAWRCRRLSALYRYNTDVDGSLDFSSWAAFTASALEVRLTEWRQGRAGFQVSKAGLLPQLNAEPAPLAPSLPTCAIHPPSTAGHEAERYQHPVGPGGGAGQLAGHHGGAQGETTSFATPLPLKLCHWAGACCHSHVGPIGLAVSAVSIGLTINQFAPPYSWR